MDATMDSSMPVETKEKVGHNYTPWLVSIAVLLTISILLSGYQIFITYQQNQIASQRAAIYEERVKEATDLVNAQQTMLFTVIDNYEKTAYGENVDRIAEQQLIATEYTMRLLQVMAVQNTQVISLIATLP